LFSKILVAIDGSKASLKALSHAVYIGINFRSHIQVISVVDELKLPFSAQYSLWAKESHDQLFRKMLEQLNMEIKRILESHPDLKIDADVIEGNPAQKIVEFAELGDYDLIVIGAKGYGMIESLVIGSVSNAVVNTSTKPVLIVK
jgi:nucleotide-binding universal stress UspA family protein